MKDLFRRAVDGFREAVERCKEWLDSAYGPQLKPSEVPVRIDE